MKEEYDFTISANDRYVRRTRCVRWEVCVCEEYFVAVAHLTENFEQGGRDDWGDTFENHGSDNSACENNSDALTSMFAQQKRIVRKVLKFKTLNGQERYLIFLYGKTNLQGGLACASVF